jgi:fibronectin-binding autotransporter adhesin
MSFRRWLRALLAASKSSSLRTNHLCRPRVESLESRLAPVGDFSFAAAFGTSNTTNVVGQSVVTDGSGNVYVAGSFKYEAQFGSILLTSSGQDAFVAKYSSTGTALWATKLAASGDDVAYGLALGSSGNVYATGSFSGSNFVGDPTINSAGGSDVFVASLATSNGAVDWAKRYGGVQNEVARAIDVDSAGNIYLTGQFFGVASFGGPTLSVSAAQDSNDGFVLKLNSSGTYVSQLAFGAAGQQADIGRAIKVSAAGTIFVGGAFAGTASFGGPTLTASGRGGFLLRIASNFIPFWVRGFGGSGNNEIASIALDASGNPIVAGTLQGGIDENPNSFSQAFVAKVSGGSVSTLIWTTPLAADAGSIGAGVAIDSAGAVYATGTFGGGTFPAGGSATLSASNNDAYVTALDGSGVVQWSRQLGGSSDARGRAIAVDSTGGIATTGQFDGSGDFDPGTSTFTLTDSTAGISGYLSRLIASSASIPDVSVALNTASVTENGSSPLVYTFTRTGSTSGSLSVTFSVGGTAALSTDYTQSGASSFSGTAGVVVIPSGSASATVTLTPVNDSTVEADETVILTAVADSAYTVSGSAATGTILNDDFATVSIVGSTVAESAGTMTFTISLSNRVDVPVSVTFNTLATGTAAAGSDFTAIASQTVTFAANDNADRTVAVLVNDDSRLEGTETVNAQISGLTVTSRPTVSLGSATAQGSILDNESATVSFSASASSLSEDTTSLAIPVVLALNSTGTGTAGLDRTIVARVADAGTGTASAGSDYAFTTSDLTFASGSDGSSFTLNASASIFEDLNSESSETINLSLAVQTDGTNGRASLASPSAHAITILDDDAVNRTYDMPTAGIYRLVLNGSNLELYQGSTLATSTPIGSSPIVINGTTGNDTLIVDLSGGNPIPSGGITFNGGLPNTQPGDKLVLQGGSATTQTYNFTNATDGSVVLSGFGTITYTGLDPISSTLTSDDVVLNYSGTSETITVQQFAADTTRTEVVSTAAESVDFVNPAKTLQIFAGGGNDTIVVNGFGTSGGGLRAALTISGDAGTDSISLNTAISLGSATSTGNVSLTAETVTLGANISTDAGTNAGSFSVTGATTLASNVTIDTDAAGTDGAISFSAPINGTTTDSQSLALAAGAANIDFTSVGAGTRLSSLNIVSANNVTATGSITVGAGGFTQTAGTGSSSFTSIQSVGGGSIGVTAATITATGTLTVSGAGNIGLTHSGANSLSINNVSLGSTGGLTVNGTTAATSGAISGVISSTGSTGAALTKSGPGSLTLGNSNTFTRPTSISNGTLLVNGSLADGAAATDVSVGSGGVLGGSGVVNGTVSVSTSGAVAPGSSPAILTVANLSYTGGSLNVELNGTTVGTQYDQLLVSGSVSLGSGVASLNVTLGFTPLAGTAFTIVNNTSGNQISGTFAGLPEGKVFVASGTTFQITYVGGDGNDIVLTAIDPAAPTLGGTSAADNFLIKLNGSNVETYLAGLLIDSRLRTSITGAFTINGLAGNDTLTVDLSAGNPIPAAGIAFNGGGQSSTPGDRLVISGGANQGTTTFNYTNANDGSIVMSNFGSITYTGLEPIVNSGTITDAVFNLPAAGSIATLGDDGLLANGLLRLSSSPATFELTDFTAPTGSLTINRGNAADTLTLTNLSDFAGGASLNLGSSGANFGNLSFAGAISANSLSAFGTSISNTAAANVAITGNASFAGTTIVLGSTSGDSFNFGTLTFVAGGAVGISEDSGTTLAGASSANSLILNSAGALTNDATASLAVTNNAEFNATSVTLGSVGGLFDFGSLTFTSIGAVDVAEDSAMLLNGANTANSLTLTSAGSLTNAASSSLAVTNGATLQGTSIDLGNAASDTINFGNINATATSTSIAIAEDSAMAVNTLSAVTTVTLSTTAAVSDANGAANNVSATTLSVTSVSGIDLDTDVGSITASASAAGAIRFDEANAVTLASITTFNGNITINAGGTVTATNVVNTTDASNVITITTTAGDILANNISAPGDTITLNAAGAIDESGSDATSDVSASIINLTAATGIGGAGTLEINAFAIANRGLTASVTGVGGIDVSDTSGGLRVRSATTNNGGITIAAVGGSLTVETIASGGSNTVSLTAASGSILDDDVDTTLVTGSNLILSALNTIGTNGGTGDLDTAANSITASTTATGANNGIWIDETDGVTLTSLTTNDGLIRVTANGNVMATLVTAGGAGRDISVLDAAGDITVGIVTADNDRVTLTTGSGSILDGNGATNNVTAADLILKATTGIGSGTGTTFSDELETTVTNADLSNTTSAGIYLRNAGALTLKDLDAVSDGLGVVSIAGGRVVASSPITVSSNQTIGASMTFVAGNSASPTDAVTFDTSAVVTFNAGAGATLRYEAGDSILFNTGSIATTGTATVQLIADQEAGGFADGLRGTVTQTGAINSVASTSGTVDLQIVGVEVGSSNAVPFRFEADTLQVDTTAGDGSAGQTRNQWLQEADSVVVNAIAGGGLNAGAGLVGPLRGHIFLDGGTFVLAAGDGINDQSAVRMIGSATLDLNNDAETIGSLSSPAGTSAAVVFGTGALTTGGNNLSTTWTSGTLGGGSGGLVKSGSGSFRLGSAGTYTFTGTVDVNAGALVVNGSLASSANAITVAANAILGGSGTLNRSLVVQGTLSPGDSGSEVADPTTVAAASLPGPVIGVLSTGTGSTVQFAATATYLVDLTLGFPPVAGTQFDQLKTDAAVTIAGGATLRINTPIAPSQAANVGASFRIVDNGSGAAISGKFGVPIDQTPSLPHPEIDPIKRGLVGGVYYEELYNAEDGLPIALASPGANDLTLRIDQNNVPVITTQIVAYGPVVEDGLGFSIVLTAKDTETANGSLTFFIDSLPNAGMLYFDDPATPAVDPRPLCDTAGFTGSQLTITSVGGVDVATLTLTYVPGGNVSPIPSPSYLDAFTYSVRDTGGLNGDAARRTASATINVTVTPSSIPDNSILIRSEPTGNVLFVTGSGSSDIIKATGGGSTFTVTRSAYTYTITDQGGGTFQLATKYGSSKPTFATLTGGAGPITEVRMFGRSGADTLDGSALSVRTSLFGGAGNDILKGGSLIDVLFGGSEVDNLYGSTGDDAMFGGAGNDTLYGDADNDCMHGGDGTDYLWGGLGNDELDGGAGVDYLYGEGGNDEISGGTENDVLRGADGDDKLNGGPGVDSLFGGTGNDTFQGFGSEAESDTFAGEGGIETLEVIAGAPLTLSAFQPSNGITLVVGNGMEIWGGLGRTVLDFSAVTNMLGVAAIDGRDGDDVITGNDQPNVIRGGNGNDYLYGRGGNDVLIGGDGVDVLDGGAGDDELWGGGGIGLPDTAMDYFSYTTASLPGAGADDIRDFTDGIDRIDLRPYSPSSYLSLQKPAVLPANGSAGIVYAVTDTATPADLILLLPNGKKIRIRNLALANLTNADFLNVI